MAEAIGLASGLLASATFAFQSSITLSNTVKSFQSHPKRVRDLLEELEALNGVLRPLTETVSPTTDVDLSALDLPLLRCGKSCKEFEQEIVKCSSRSSGGRTSFRDWAKLRYMGEDIDGFRRLLAGYKLTIHIALTNVNLRKSSSSAENLQSYKDLIKTATVDLEAHMKNIDEKLKIIFEQTVTESDLNEAERRLIKEEQSSMRKCLQICAQSSDRIDQILLMPKHSGSSPGMMNPDAFLENVTDLGLQEGKNRMADPINISSDLLSLAAFAVQSSKALYQAFAIFQNNGRTVREFKKELTALYEVLQSVQEAVEKNDTRLSALKLPLLSCGKACEEFATEVAKTTAYSNGSRASFPDWARLKYMGEDIAGIRSLMGGYKFTFAIALFDAKIRSATVTADLLIEFRDVINVAVADLKELLHGIDTKSSRVPKNPANKGDSQDEEHSTGKKERASIQQCLRICEEVSAHIDQVQAKDLADAPTFSNERQAPSTDTFKDYRVFVGGGEDHDEIASVRSVDSMGSTATGSSATLVGEALPAANEFVSLLLEDQTLTPLLLTAFDHIKADKLERNFTRLLKVYAIDLRQEAAGDIEKEAVQLILMRARYIACRIRQRYDKSALDNAGRFERLTDQSPGKRALLEDYLKGRVKTRQSIETSLLGPDVDDDDDGDASNSSASSEVEADQLELNDLDRVKVFMVQSAAYHKFRQNLRDFILPRRESGQQGSASATSSFFYLDTWRRIQIKGIEAIHGLRMLLRPLVPPGHERITWICGCGDHRYADIHGYKPNGASTLQAVLRRSAAAANAHGTSGGGSNAPRPPTQAHLPGSSIANLGLHSVPPSGNVYTTGTVPTNNATGSSIVGPPSAYADQSFLLLCLTISGTSTLEQLSMRDLDNDQYMWDKIRERYHELRGKALWYQKHAMTKWLSTVSWLSWLVTAIDLTSPHSIEFVRFQLVPIAMDIRPWNFHSPSLPPEAEVRVKKTYHYDPCPTDGDPNGFNEELLHCLWKPGPHLDRFWLDFFPKKLKETLQYVSSKPEMNTGWGIRVVEGINWAAVTFVAFILVGTSAVLGIIYSAITHDVGGAFGMAAFLGTLPALGIALLHLRPID